MLGLNGCGPQDHHPVSKQIDHSRKEEIREKETFIAEHSWLRRSCFGSSRFLLSLSHSITHNIFSLVCGDAFAIGTPMQGLTLAKANGFFRDFFQQNKEVDLGLPTEMDDLKGELLGYFNETYALAHQFESKSTSIESLANQLAEKCKRQGTVWIPGGWISPGGGHAILYCVNLTERRVDIINTGDGLEHCPMANMTKVNKENGQLDHSLKAQCQVTIKNIDPNKLTDPLFYRSLLEPGMLPIKDKSHGFGAEQVYKGIVNYLGGEVEVAYDPNTDPEMFVTFQRSGSCAVRCLSKGIYYFLLKKAREKNISPKIAIAAYKKLKFNWQWWCVLSWHKQTLEEQAKSGFSEADRTLLKDIFNNLARSSTKLADEGLIDELKLKQVKATLWDLQEMLEKAPKLASPKQIKEKSKQKKIPITIYRPATDLAQAGLKKLISGAKWLTQGTCIDTTVIGCAGKIRDIAEKACWAVNFHPYLATSSYHLIEQLRLLSAEKPETADDLLSHLETARHILSRHTKKKSEENKDPVEPAVSSAAIDLFHSLPMPKKGKEDIWDTIPTEDIPACMEAIDRLHQTISDEMTARDYLAAYGLLAIQDKLARRLPESKLDGFETNYTELIDALCKPNFTLGSPESHEKLVEVLKYFLPEITFDQLASKGQSTKLIQQLSKETNYLNGLTSKRENYLFGMPITGRYTVNSKNIKSDTTLKYIKQFLDYSNPDIIKRLKFQGINQNAAIEEQVLAIYCDRKKTDHLDTNLSPSLLSSLDFVNNKIDLQQCLPDSVIHLRNTALRTSCITHPDILPWLKSQKIDCVPNYSLNKKKNGDVEFHLYPYGKNIHKNYDLQFKMPTHPVVEEDAGKSPNRLIAEDQPVDKLSPNESRDLRMLGGDPFDEADRVLAYLTEHKENLHEKSIQENLSIHLFRFERLKSQLEDSPRFASEVGNRLMEAIDFHRRVDNPETYIFLATLGCKLGLFVDRHAPEQLAKYPDFRALIYDSLVPALKSRRTNPGKYLNLLFDHLALTYADITHPETQNNDRLKQAVTEDVLAWKINRTSGLNVEISLPNVQETIKKLTPVAEEMIYWSVFKRNRVFDRLIKIVYPDAYAGGMMGWWGAYPSFYSGNYRIHVTTGTVEKTIGTKRTTLPADVYEDELFPKLCRGDIGHIEQHNASQYTVHPQGLHISIALNRTIIFSKEIDGEIYEYVRETEAIQELLPTLTSQLTNCWMQDGEHPHILAETKDQSWLRIDLDPYRLNNFGANLAASYVKKKYSIDQVTQTRQSGNDEVLYTLVPGDRLPTIFDSLKPFEKNLNWIECWRREGEPEDVISELRLPEKNIAFHLKRVDGEVKYECGLHPGYYLQPREELSQLDRNLDYLLLENKDGHRKILVLNNKLETKHVVENSKFHKLITLDKEINGSFWHSFDVNNSHLTTSKIEDQLYLLYLHSIHGRHDEAQEISQLIEPIDRFSKSQLQTINWCLEALGKNNHPSSWAILMRLCESFLTNRKKYPLAIGQTEDPPITYIKLLEFYVMGFLSGRKNAQKLGMTEENERKFLNLMKELKEVKSEKKEEESIDLSGFETIIEERIKYLNTGCGTLHSRKVSLFQEENPISSPLLSSDIQTQFENKQTSKNPLARNVGFSSLFLKNPEELKSKFYEYYLIAREGADNDRHRLQATLKLHEEWVKPEIKGAIEKLLAVLKNPDAYPTARIIKQSYDEYKLCERNYHNNKDDKLKYALKTEYHDAENRYIAHFATIAGSVQLNTTKYIWSHALTLLSETWSWIAPNLSLKRIFKEKHTKPSQQKIEAELFFGGSRLPENDQHVESCFSNLVNKYFTCRDIPIQNHLPNLPTTHDDPLVAKKLVEEQAALEEYRSLQKPELEYSLRFFSNLENLQNELTNAEKHWNSELTEQKKNLLWQANRSIAPENLTDADELKKMGKGHRVDMDEVVEMFIRGDLNLYREKTRLSNPEAEKLYEATAEYLLKATRHQQMKKAIVTIKQINTGNHDPETRKQLVEELNTTLKMKRHYQLNSQDKRTFAIQRIMLAHEYANAYLYREEQVAKIHEILENIEAHPENLAKMPTGYGKTKTICPTLDEILLQAGKHIINIWPAELEVTNSLDSQGQMKSGFKRSIDRLRFNRTSDLDAKGLAFLYEAIREEQKSGKPLNMRPESVRSLELHLLVTLHKLSNDSDHLSYSDTAELKDKATQLIKILRFFRCVSWATIDEAHRNLHPKDKIIYTDGKPTHVPDEQLELIEFVMRECLKDPIDSILHLKSDQERYFNKAQWKDLISERLADACANHIGIAAENREVFKKFVLGTEEKLPSFIQDQNTRVLTDLTKGLLVQILQSALNGNVDENYGFSHLHFEKKEYAISYRGHKTPKETELTPSQFKNPHETFVKTHISYLRKGLTPTQVAKFINFLKVAAKEEDKPIGESNADRFYESLFDGNPPKKLNFLNEDDIEEMTDHLKMNTDAIFYYVRYIVKQQYKLHPLIFPGTTQNFRTQFASSLSLTATPPQTESIGPNTNFIPMKGSTGRITHLLLSKNADPSTLHVINSTDPEGTVDEALEIIDNNPRMKATIDIGALIKGMTNEQAAKRLGEHFSGREDLHGVLFFDEKSGRFKVFNIGAGRIQEFEGCELSPGERFTLYDQNRCFGSDLKQDPLAIALTLLGKKNTKDTADQGNGRMRGLMKRQSIEWLIQQQMAQDIFKSGNKNIMELLVFLISNQAHDEAENNFDTQMQQMDNELRRACLDKMFGLDLTRTPEQNATHIDDNVDVNRAISLFGKFEKRFVSSETCDPVAMYEGVSTEIAAKDCLEEKYHLTHSHLQGMSGLTGNEKAHIATKLNKYPQTWETLPLPQSHRKNSPEMGMECEVMEEQEVEQEIEVQVERQESWVERTPWSWSTHTDLFKAGWESPTTITHFLFFKRLSRAIIKMGQERIQAAAHFARKKIKNVFKVDNFKQIGEWFDSHPPTPRNIAVVIVAAGAIVVPTITLGVALWKMRTVVVISLAAITANYMTSMAYQWTRGFFGINCPVYKAQEILAYHLPRKYLGVERLFGRNVLMSNNFFTHNPGSMIESQQKLFDNDQKPLYNVLFIQDTLENGTKKLQMMMIDQNDSIHFRRMLKKDRTQETTPDGRQRKIAIYDLDNGIVSEGKNRFNDGELEANTDFAELTVLAKLLKPRIRLSEDEIRLVEQLARRNGVELGQLDAFIAEQVLLHHPTKRVAYKHTPLSKRLQGVA